MRQKKQQREKERTVAEAYRQRFGTWYEDAVFRTDLVCRMLGPERQFSRILDGAGFFPTAHVFADRYPQAHVTMVNLFPEDDVLPEYRSRITHVQADITALPLPDDHVDLAFMGEVFEHVYDLPRAFDEVARVLTPGGYLALTTPNLAAWYNRLALLAGKCPPAYHPTPVMYPPALLEKCRREYHDPKRREFPLHHFHIRVFTVDRLLDYVRLKKFVVESFTVRNLCTPDRRLHRVRRLLEYVLPLQARENIIVVARNGKKTNGSRQSPCASQAAGAAND